MLSDSWSQNSGPKVRFFKRCFSFSFVFEFLRWSFGVFLDNEVGVFFVYDVLFLRSLRKHMIGHLLHQLTKVAPEVWMLSYWALAMVRTGSNDAGLAPVLGQDPLPDRVDVPKALR